MSVAGHSTRNKSTLYKPTDFVSKNRSALKKTENDMEEQQNHVVKKIQQRPTPSDEKPEVSELVVSTEEEKEEPPKRIEKHSGVSDKDVEKIQKLQEFMSKIGVSEDEGNVGKETQKEENMQKNKAGESRYQKPFSKPKNEQTKPNERLFNSKTTSNHPAPRQVLAKNQRGGYDYYRGRPRGAENMMGINSFYSNPMHGVGMPNEMQWLQMQYAMNNHNHSILGNPYNQQQQPQQQQQQNFAKMNQVNNQPHGASYASSKSTSSTRDKSEHKKSLDFVKNFFNNDPEVQYTRKKLLEKRAAEKSTSLAHSVSHHSLCDSQVNSPIVVSSQTNLYHPTSLYTGSTAYQVPTNIHSTGIHTNATANFHPVVSNTIGTHAAGSNSDYSQHIQHQGHILQQQSSGYQEVFSQPSGIYHQTLQHTTSNPNTLRTYSNYPNYFPSGSHNSHVGHIQQHIDPNVVSNILQGKKPLKWQKSALSRCGPIDSSQARCLIEQLINGTYECMICCDQVKWNHEVWSCTNCFHVFHLKCIKKWARSETAIVKDESGWRCPGCQHVCNRPPNSYYCFCGKVRDPDWNPRDGITPHTCGEICKKKRQSPACDHGCNELCHPGPCPSCPVMVTKYCPCGEKQTLLRCGQPNPIKCFRVCSKLLNCSQHKCQLKCHEGPCKSCKVKYSEECFCGNERRYVLCGTGESLTDCKPDSSEECQRKYCCQKPCGKELSCKNHPCEDICHVGNCKECSFLPSVVTFCPCGKVPIDELMDGRPPRSTCLDDIPTCESFCGKKLACGPKGSSHLCMQKCHNGKCKPCNKMSTVQCRCGATKKDLMCQDLMPGKDILCERKCNKKRRCGRHKCNQKCCTERDHTCNIICGKKLSCGMHKCDEVCHAGFCPPCWRAGFDELACHCGATVLYPPIACGTKPPDCDQPCMKEHHCDHQPQHTCHSESSCPPCTVLSSKPCMGGHEVWKNIPCYLTEVSCGQACGKTISCGLHTCIRKCHKGVCVEGETCTQPCPVKRRDCSHPCNALCHVGIECPSTPCKAQITIYCRCKRLTANALCLAGNVNSIYENFNAEQLSSQLRSLQSGQSIDIASLTNAEKRPKFLDCDEECSRIERNKRLAEALGIENTGGGHFQHANFTMFLREQAKIQYPFIQMLEALLETLILRLKKSSQDRLHHAFPPMNLNQRKIIHELADAYGCKTYSQDQEPNRNTVVVATKDSFIPQVKLSLLTEREFKQRSAPQPVMVMKNHSVVLAPSSATAILQMASIDKPNYFDDIAKD